MKSWNDKDFLVFFSVRKRTKSGSIARPRIRIDDGATFASLRTALVAAGQAELVSRANQLLGKIAPEGVEIQLPPGVLDEVKKLLPGLGQKNDE